MRGEDAALFGPGDARQPRGRVRRGLDADVRDARAAGVDLPAGLVAALRAVADQIDLLDAACRHQAAKPYDRMPLTGLVRQYGDLYGQTFAGAAAAADPLTRALADFMAANVGAPPPPGDAQVQSPD